MIINEDSLVQHAGPEDADPSIGRHTRRAMLPLGRFLTAADKVKPDGPVEQTPSDQKEKIKSAYREADAATNGHPTGKAMKAAVNQIDPPKRPTLKSLFDFKVKMNPCDVDQWANWEAAQQFWRNQQMWVREVGGDHGLHPQVDAAPANSDARQSPIDDSDHATVGDRIPDGRDGGGLNDGRETPT